MTACKQTVIPNFKQHLSSTSNLLQITLYNCLLVYWFESYVPSILRTHNFLHLRHVTPLFYFLLLARSST